jgi:glyoxylase-like metal-dependent hydrolase (beta-lactamase superfamily II)
MAANAEHILKMVADDTIVIPGHGPVAKKSDVKDFADMLSASLEILSKEFKSGKSLEQIQAAKPLAAYDDKWGQGFMKADVWIALNYAGMRKT